MGRPPWFRRQDRMIVEDRVLEWNSGFALSGSARLISLSLNFFIYKMRTMVPNSKNNFRMKSFSYCSGHGARCTDRGVIAKAERVKMDRWVQEPWEVVLWLRSCGGGWGFTLHRCAPRWPMADYMLLKIASLPLWPCLIFAFRLKFGKICPHSALSSVMNCSAREGM